MKIGIIGSGRTMADAPYGDPSWRLYGVGTRPKPGLVDGWYEIHDPSVLPIITPSYWRVLGSVPEVWCADALVCLAMGSPGRLLPMDRLEGRFGTEFLSSSVSIAMAHCLHLGVEAIGLWGVEQSRNYIYRNQRSGTLFFVKLARELGVSVVMPDDCPLNFERPRYPLEGYDD